MQKLLHCTCHNKNGAAVAGTDVGGGIKNTSEFMVLNFLNAIRSPNADASHQELANK